MAYNVSTTNLLLGFIPPQPVPWATVSGVSKLMGESIGWGVRTVFLRSDFDGVTGRAIAHCRTGQHPQPVVRPRAELVQEE